MSTKCSLCNTKDVWVSGINHGSWEDKAVCYDCYYILRGLASSVDNLQKDAIAARQLGLVDLAKRLEFAHKNVDKLVTALGLEREI